MTADAAAHVLFAPAPASRYPRGVPLLAGDRLELARGASARCIACGDVTHAVRDKARSVSAWCAKCGGEIGVLPPLGSREPFPVGPHHRNYRNDARTVAEDLKRAISAAQQRYGTSFASEGGIRRWIWEDCGRVPGEDTVRTDLERQCDRGVMVQAWCRRGDGRELPNGKSADCGTRFVRIVKTAPEIKRWRELYPDGRVPAATPRDLRVLAAKIGGVNRPTIPRVPDTAPRSAARNDAEVARQRAALAAWLAEEQRAGRATGPDPPDE